MFRLVVLLSCIVAAFAAPSIEDRILGGSTAPEGAYPHQISLRTASGHSCGGTIITSRHIVTAAHCVYGNSGQLHVVVGTNSISSGGDRYELQSIVHHEAYNPQSFANDIALLTTTQEIQFKSTVQPLPLQQQEVPVGGVLTLSGWGLTAWPPTGLPDRLQQINLRKIDINVCAQRMASINQIFTSQICTESPFGQGACQGDSGGPLIYNGALSGVVSWGKPCAAGYPDVFTKVSDYIQWIQQHM